MAFLRSKVLVPLRAHLFEAKAKNSDTSMKQNATSTEKHQTKLRSYLAVSLMNLTRRLPFPIFKVEFSKLLILICNLLKNRDLKIRESARKALSDIIGRVGPAFLHFVINALKTSLSNGGYQAHVLNYTLYIVLKQCVLMDASTTHNLALSLSLSSSTGRIDYCLSSILPLLFDEALGKLQEEKEAEELK